MDELLKRDAQKDPNLLDQLDDLKERISTLERHASGVAGPPGPTGPTGLPGPPGDLGGGTCRVIEQATGWYITAGINNARYIEHGLGFRLDSGGDARGTRAVDLQTDRNNATEVASGQESFLAGGANNTASNYGDAVIGGYGNSVNGGAGVYIGGGDGLIDGYAAIGIGGYDNQAPIDYTIVKGSGAKTHSYFQEAHGQRQQNVGDAQVSRFPLSALHDHNNATWRTLDLFTDEGINIPADTVMTFRALIVGATQGCAKSFSFEIVGKIKNDGGTTTLDASTVTTIDDSDDTSFDCRALANDTDDTLEIQVSDADGASDSVKWCARVVTAEVTWDA